MKEKIKNTDVFHVWRLKRRRMTNRVCRKLGVEPPFSETEMKELERRYMQSLGDKE